MRGCSVFSVEVLSSKMELSDTSVRENYLKRIYY